MGRLVYMGDDTVKRVFKPEEFMKRFARVGREVRVFYWALILKPEAIELGDYVRIDDYARVEGGEGLRIGRYVHICSFASIYGGGEAQLGDYCGITQGARLITGTEQLDAVMSAAAPEELRNPHRGRIILERHCFIGANAVVMPDITVGEGAVVGAGAVVTKDVLPWTVVTGVPARPVGRRERISP
jgi:acetyltransferase-like isoleucine patch superfamily enzyme